MTTPSRVTPAGLGLIGVGSHALRNLLPAFKETPQVNLVGMAGRDPSRLAATAEAYGCRVFTTPERLIEDPEVQVVYVAVPVGLHARWTAEALRAGKHVFCEKSLTSTLEDGKSLIQLSRERDTALCEAWMFRFHPQFECLQRLLAEGAIGRVQSITARFGIPHLSFDNVRYDPTLGGGALLDAGGYTVAAARLLIGPEPSSCVGSIEVSPGFLVDTAGSALLRYENGVHAHLEWGFGRHYRNEIGIWGELGSLSVNRAFSKPSTLATTIHVEKAGGEGSQIAIPPENHFVRMLAAFLVALSDADVREGFRREIEQQQNMLFEIARQGRLG